VTIHSDHPFATPEGQRDPARRLRGRLGGAVTLLTSGSDSGSVSGSAGRRAGLTVSSLLIAPGEPDHLLALVDPDSDLAETLAATGRGVVHLLSWEHRDLAEAFAGLAPAPGGVFRLGSWEQSAWGPVLQGVSAWAGFVVAEAPAPVGWSLLVDGVLEEIRLGEPAEPLVHRRGRYVAPR
jgi:flavin reductase (DIM6/NTAB) family NADH-FMN oxidoreductase RutF